MLCPTFTSRSKGNRYMSLNLTRTGKAALTVAAMGLLVLTGCGEKRIHVVPVSGKLTVQGQPAAGAQVVLHPVAADRDEPFAAVGQVQNDGTFKIGVYDRDDGAPPGEY